MTSDGFSRRAHGVNKSWLQGLGLHLANGVVQGTQCLPQ